MQILSRPRKKLFRPEIMKESRAAKKGSGFLQANFVPLILPSPSVCPMLGVVALLDVDSALFGIMHFISQKLEISMGFNCSCIAIKNDNEAEVLEFLGLIKTYERPKGFYAKSSKKEIVGGIASTGWYLVLDSTWQIFQNKQLVSQVSLEKKVIGCEVGESWNNSKTECWKAGERIWSVAHDLHQGQTHLQEEGNLPKEYQSIKAEILKTHESTSQNFRIDTYFSIPTDLFAKLVGFNYDYDSYTLVKDYSLLKLESSVSDKSKVDPLVLPETKESTRTTLRARFDIKPGEIIRKDSFLPIKESRRYEDLGKFEGYIQESAEIVGLKATQYIHKGEMLTKFHFSEQEQEY